jgi:hypothetical protein
MFIVVVMVIVIVIVIVAVINIRRSESRNNLDRVLLGITVAWANAAAVMGCSVLLAASRVLGDHDRQPPIPLLVPSFERSKTLAHTSAPSTSISLATSTSTLPGPRTRRSIGRGHAQPPLRRVLCDGRPHERNRLSHPAHEWVHLRRLPATLFCLLASKLSSISSWSIR